VLYSFTQTGGDGASPYASVVFWIRPEISTAQPRTAENGGNCSCSGCGVVFKLDTSGRRPFCMPLQEAQMDYPPQLGSSWMAGDVYGVAGGGGCCGVVFKLPP
jgi:hypothetical protein